MAPALAFLLLSLLPLLLLCSFVFICGSKGSHHARDCRKISEQDAAQPEGADVLRPTSDRLRETLFNILGPAVAGGTFVDLYAGTGAVGIEALSRGARHAILVEQHAPAVELIRRNLGSLGIGADAEVLGVKVARAIEQLEMRHVHAQFIFLDPPYAADGEYESALDALGESPLVAPEGRVIVEHLRKPHRRRAETRNALAGLCFRAFDRSTEREGHGNFSDAAADQAADNAANLAGAKRRRGIHSGRTLIVECAVESHTAAQVHDSDGRIQMNLFAGDALVGDADVPIENGKRRVAVRRPPFWRRIPAAPARLTPGKWPFRTANLPVPERVFFQASLRLPRSCKSSSPVPHPVFFPRAAGFALRGLFATSRLRYLLTLAVKRAGIGDAVHAAREICSVPPYMPMEIGHSSARSV